MLVVADTHIPERAERVPGEMLELIDSLGPYDAVIHAGDLVSEEVLDWVRGLAPRAVVVRGNMDYLPLPLHARLEAGGCVIGVYHGHRVYPRGDPGQLAAIARRMGVRVLVTGHTHYPFIRRHGGVVLLNPGSLTGVWGGGGGSMKPSLMLLEASGGGLRAVIYESRRGRVVESASAELEC